MAVVEDPIDVEVTSEAADVDTAEVSTEVGAVEVSVEAREVGGSDIRESSRKSSDRP